MPISKSAKKSLRVSQHKASLNRYRKALIKDALKNVTAETAAKAISMIDKGAKWGLFHPNKAARMKSTLSKKIGAPIAASKPEVAKAAKSAAKPKATVKKTATKPAAKAKKATKNPPAGGKK